MGDVKIVLRKKGFVVRFFGDRIFFLFCIIVYVNIFKVLRRFVVRKFIDFFVF